MLAQALQDAGVRLFNSAAAIAACDDKGETARRLAKVGLPMPKTILAPKVFEGNAVKNNTFIEMLVETLGFPLVAKERFGSQGAQITKIDNWKQLTAYYAAMCTRPILFQQHIPQQEMQDVRVNVVGGKVIASIARTADAGVFAANVAAGGKAVLFEPNEQQKQLAVKCADCLGLDFAGVDLLLSPQEALVLEVNSNPQTMATEEATGISVADAIIEHIMMVMKINS